MPAKQTEGGITIVLKDNTTKEINKIQRKARNHGFYMDPIFDEIKRDISSAINVFSTQIMNTTEETLKAKVPYDSSPSRDHDRLHQGHKKHLRDNIKKKIKNKGKYTIEIFVGWDYEYKKIAQYVNDGVRDHWIGPKNKESLLIPMPTSPSGSRGSDGFLYVRQGVFHPGFEGRHFIDDTFFLTTQNIDQRFKNCLDAFVGY